jgi:hypothetical protein
LAAARRAAILRNDPGGTRLPHSGVAMNPPTTAPAVGVAAPPFSLRRTFEEQVALADLLERGPVVIAFYVFDFGDI